MTCNCKVCQYANEVDVNLQMVGDLVDKKTAKFFEDMYWRLCGAETDNAVNRAMVRNQWPSGRFVYIPKGCNAQLQKPK